MTLDLETLSNADFMRCRRITQHATVAFLSCGYAATSVEDIAIDASVSKMTVYRLFVDKLGLARAVMQELANSLEAHCQRSIDMTSPAEDGLVHFGVTYVKWMIKSVGATQHYALTRLLIEMSSSHPDFAREWVERHQRVVAVPLSQYLEKRIQTGEISGDESPVFIASQFIGNLVHSSGILVIKDKFQKDFNRDLDELVRRKVRLLLRGCASGQLDEM